jgi:hypothetical protein
VRGIEDKKKDGEDEGPRIYISQRRKIRVLLDMFELIMLKTNHFASKNETRKAVGM